ncbi:MAG TPA: carboxypeptidase-like regulatory domain-containing protein, partial [Blastocatellia bacterium]|nr:carboxypeptidase-like regulatory domain-containing protein [Blastocatellia bacterium]
MSWIVCWVFLILPVVATYDFAQAQSSAKEVQGTGSVSGTVTLNGKPVAGIKVVALRGGRFMAEPVAVGVTDANGQYRLQGLAAGTCSVGLDAASFAWKREEPDDETSSKSVRLAEGESVEGINIEVVPGGVITGRVTDSSGRPIIDETVRIIPFKEVQDEREEDR